MASVEWSVEDIRTKAKNWSLEGDSQILDYMRNISDNLLKRANCTLDNVNKMDICLEKCSITFENISNKLSALSKSQFVENRVIDDDEFEAKGDLLIENEKMYNPTETLKVIVQNNLKMLVICYDKISVNLDDSDDEDDNFRSTIIYRPKNLFGKPLPALIGSEEWNKKWHIGLIDSDDESISEKGSSHEEFSDDSVENISLPSIGPTISESGSSVWSINRNLPAKIKSNKFITVESSDDEVNSYHTIESKTSSEELRTKTQNIYSQNQEKYYVHKHKEQSICNVDSTEENKNDAKLQLSTNYHRTEKNNREAPKISNIFSDEPPELDSDDSYKNLNKSHLATSPDNIKNSLAKCKENIVKNEESVKLGKTTDIFHDNDFDSFIKEIDIRNKEKILQTNDSKKVNLFDSDSETETFESNQIDHAQIESAKIINPKNTDPKINLSIEKPNNFIKSNDLFDDFDENNDFFSKNNENKQSAGLSSAHFTKTKISNLFDDEPPEDDFDNLFKTDKRTNNILQKEQRIQNFPENNINNRIGKETNQEKQSDNSLKQLNETVIKVDEKAQKEICTKRKKTVGFNRKSLASNLFSNDWSDDEEALLSTTTTQDENVNSEIYNEQETLTPIQYPLKTNIKQTNENDNSSATNFGKLSNVERDEFLEHKTPLLLNKCNTEKEIIKNVKTTMSDKDQEIDSNVLKYQDDQKSMETLKKGESICDKTLENSNENESFQNNTEPELNSNSLSLNKTDNTKTQNDIYSILFSDTPPEDEEIFIKTNEKITDSLFTVNEYSSSHLNLFDDIPPDDFANDVIKHSDHNLNEDFQSSNEIKCDNELSSNYIITDEPPPDDYFRENIESKRSNLVSDSINFEKNMVLETSNSFFENKFDNTLTQNKTFETMEKLTSKNLVNELILVHDKLSEEAKNPYNFPDEKTLRKPKKLNSTIAIDVNALLPGAKRIEKNKNIDDIDCAVNLASDTKLEDKNEGNFSNNEQDELNKTLDVGVNYNFKQQESEDASKEKLIGLTKGRIKILTKRRPSTRKGRQESYKKSKENDFSLSDSEKDLQPNMIKKAETKENKTGNTNLRNVEKETLLNAINNDSNDQSNVVNIIETDEILSKQKIKNTKVKSKENNIVALFDENYDGSDNSDWFNKISTKNNNSLNYKNIDIIKKSSFNDLFKDFEKLESKSTDNKICKDSETDIADRSSNLDKPKLIENNYHKKSVSLNHNAEDLNIKKQSPKAQEPNVQKNEVDNFKGDFNIDDDDLFSSPFVKVVSTQISNPILTEQEYQYKQQYIKKEPTNNEMDNEIFKKVKIKKQSLENIKSIAQNDRPNKNLFENPKLLRNNSKSLFSSDENDDDDILFNSNNSGSKNKSKIYKKETDKNLNKSKEIKKFDQHQSGESLFDDIGNDEDDDLFGFSKISKAVSSKFVNKTQQNRGAIPKYSLKKKITKIEDSNNPLADLLDQ